MLQKKQAVNLTKISALALLAGCCCALQAQDAKQLVQQAVNSELAKHSADHSLWMYYEVESKPPLTAEQWVEGTAQVNVLRIVKRNGQPVPVEQQRKQVEAFVHDPGLQAQQRADTEHDDEQAASLLKLLPVAFLWTETSRNLSTTTFHFKPDPNFQPPTREARVFAAMEGELTVDNAQQRIEEINGRLIHDVNFGWGLLGKLDAGGTFQLIRRQIGQGVWHHTETHIHIQGHALLFKSISEDEDDVKTLWQPAPDSLTLDQAADAVMER
ncbi:MAG TPA: hypothetical protein VFW25_00340 [Silvibacterium sp.]|nr:hypothetical protein [Silvibacterium sp.]